MGFLLKLVVCHLLISFSHQVSTAENALPLPLLRQSRNANENNSTSPSTSRVSLLFPIFNSSHLSQSFSKDTQENLISSSERCIEKVMMIEEIEYENTMKCHHSYDKRCHTTYITDYHPQQKEDCDENFLKDCYIEYKIQAFNETVRICQEKYERNCETNGPTVCETVYESECETRYHEHEIEEDTPNCDTIQIEKCHDLTEGYTSRQECDKWPKQVCSLSKQKIKRYTPETQCHKKPRNVCGPGPCPLVPGANQCREEVKTIIQEVPEETCSLNPQKVCKLVTVLIPRLKPRENCVDVPKEICTRMRRNPRKVKRPIIKKWCYTPKTYMNTTTTSTTEKPFTTTTTIKPSQLYDTPFAATDVKYYQKLPDFAE